MLQYDFEQSITYWVILTSQALERALNAELAPHGITGPQMKVLAWISLDGELSQTELADRVGVEPPTLAGILDRMERAGWITRVPSAEDRRKKIVRPTPRVEPIWSQMVSCALAVRSRAVRDIPPNELHCTMRTLAKILDNLGCPRRCAPPPPAAVAEPTT